MGFVADLPRIWRAAPMREGKTYEAITKRANHSQRRWHHALHDRRRSPRIEEPARSDHRPARADPRDVVMLRRISAIAMNAYREAVRARVLYGLLAFALAACGYSVIVASLSLDQQARVVSDVGSASISLCAVLVAIVLGATSLYRELELKTIFPILARPLFRHEYLPREVFRGLSSRSSCSSRLMARSCSQSSPGETGASIGWLGFATVALLAVLGLALWRMPHARVQVVVPWALASFVVMAILAAPAAGNRQLVLASCVLTLSRGRDRHRDRDFCFRRSRRRFSRPFSRSAFFSSGAPPTRSRICLRKKSVQP